MKPEDAASLIAGSLDVRGYEIFTAFPAIPLKGADHGNIWVASLGLVDKMTGGVALISSSIEMKDNGRVSVDVKLKALGVVGKWKELDLTSRGAVC
jgi:hypothetical protein